MPEAAGRLPQATTATRIRLAGHVQGVGFRPFVYRLAVELGLSGSVRNRHGEVEVIAAGTPDQLERFARDLIERAPPLARPQLLSATQTTLPDTGGFEILESEAGAKPRVFVPPDYFMCDECRAELADPDNRRFSYPFINCTQCGPRYTLIRALPYDRPNTSMGDFPLCADCEAEYRDPADRRFHAEPVACATCGPALTFVDGHGTTLGDTTMSLAAAVAALQAGRVVAVKGIGGYHLLCDARDAVAVARLRERKHRPDKPLAIMFPTAGNDGLDIARKYVRFEDEEAAAVSSPARPIVLVTRHVDCALAWNVAPGLAEVGVFLPYSPLHQMLLERFGGPLVATSGNISGEPVLTDNEEARARLARIADAFLEHDRPIVRPADDPVMRRIAGMIRPIRVGRGTSPLELEMPWPVSSPVLCTGGHMKGTVALAWERRVVVSPHIGEMDSPRSLDVFEQVASDLQALYGVQAERLACDAHPGYTTTRWAKRHGLPVQYVWHHEAHASALAAEHPGGGEWLVFAWDGVGLGRDGTLWGGEALLGVPGRWVRVGSLRPFRLPGGERAGREPWRSAAALHWEAGLEWPGCPDAGIARAAWAQGINAPATSAAGRLFDAAAALVCGTLRTSFEAQGPMQLEALCRGPVSPVALGQDELDGVLRIDWSPLLAMLADDAQEPAARADRFHSSIAAALVGQAVALRARHGDFRIGLTGGVFQNRVLSERAAAGLADAGFELRMPATLPGNDAGLSFGQAVEVAATEMKG